LRRVKPPSSLTRGRLSTVMCSTWSIGFPFPGGDVDDQRLCRAALIHGGGGCSRRCCRASAAVMGW
jgi:hypothetical protein